MKGQLIYSFDGEKGSLEFTMKNSDDVPKFILFLEERLRFIKEQWLKENTTYTGVKTK